MVDANYTDSGDTEYVAKVVYDLSDPYAKEEGYVELDSDAEEVLKTPYTQGEGI
jgi:flagellar basal body rod protein FlgC